MARILVVDDDDLVRYSLRLMLAREGHEIAEAADGRKAIAMHEASPFPLIITDLIMPDMEGIETIQKIRKMSPETAIIAISGGGRSTPSELLKMADRSGANAVFAKPVEWQEMIKSVARLLGTAKPGPPVGPAIS